MTHLFRWPLLSMIWIYRTFMSPLFVPTCRFYPTCSQYALTALKRHGVFKGTFLTVKRLAKCHPWGGQGCDPVPNTPSNK